MNRTLLDGIYVANQSYAPEGTLILSNQDIMWLPSEIQLTGLDFKMVYLYKSLPERPDPLWRGIDDEGHEHRWYYQVDGTATLPTLDYVEDQSNIIERYPYIEGRYKCAICGEEIFPGYWKPIDLNDDHPMLAKWTCRAGVISSPEVDAVLLEYHGPKVLRVFDKELPCFITSWNVRRNPDNAVELLLDIEISTD